MNLYASSVVAVAKKEVGYIEKSNSSLYYLYSKDSNTGSSNYTKYAKDIDDGHPTFYNTAKQGFDWCAVFVDWCFLKAFGEENAQSLLFLSDYSDGAGCEQAQGHFEDAGRFYTNNPHVGDQIFFTFGHTGIVYNVANGKVYTIEGNANQQVKYNSYYLTDSTIAGYGRPYYQTQSQSYQNHTVGTNDKIGDIAISYGLTAPDILSYNNISSIYPDLVLHIPFAGRRSWVERFQEALMEANVVPYYSWWVDGSWGSQTESAASNTIVQNGSYGTMAYFAQQLLDAYGYSIILDGDFGNQSVSTLCQYQSDHGLTVDGWIGLQTWKNMLHIS